MLKKRKILEELNLVTYGKSHSSPTTLLKHLESSNQFLKFEMRSALLNKEEISTKLVCEIHIFIKPQFPSIRIKSKYRKNSHKQPLC